jgi:probable F420-dependent oxidoreductase
MQLGPIGALLPVSFTDTPPVAAQRAAARRLEAAGYGALWANEIPGKDALVQAALLLDATEHVVLGTCVANVWVRAAPTAHAAAALLAQTFPGRFVLGLGAGHPEQAAALGRDYGSPVRTVREYRTAMTATLAPDAPYPCLLAANGPRMLALAAEIADGALPAMVEPSFTREARRVLGPDRLLVVLTRTDPDEVRAHHAAGADHVIVSVPPGGDLEAGVEALCAVRP